MFTANLRKYYFPIFFHDHLNSVRVLFYSEAHFTFHEINGSEGGSKETKNKGNVTDY